MMFAFKAIIVSRGYHVYKENGQMQNWMTKLK